MTFIEEKMHLNIINIIFSCFYKSVKYNVDWHIMNLKQNSDIWIMNLNTQNKINNDRDSSTQSSIDFIST